MSSPSAISTSSTDTTGAHPCCNNKFVPADEVLRGEPGTAITVISRFCASSTVIMEPPVARDSTTTTTSDNAASTRLRRGNRYGSGEVPGGDSLSSNPCSETKFHSSIFSFGYTTSRPDATTPMGIPRRERSLAREYATDTPLCAHASMPRARPDTVAIPCSARSNEICDAMYLPAAVAERVPTMPTRR